MLVRWHVQLVKLGVLSLIGLILPASATPAELPLSVQHFGLPDATCSESTCDSSVLDSGPGVAMLQQRFERVSVGKIHGDPAAKRQTVSSKPFRWGESPENEHPHSIGKFHPHPRVQQYEAKLPYLSSMVLNIFSKHSDGKGGLMVALEVASPCGKSDEWVEVDRVRCSSRYPCALRLPSIAVRGSESEPTVFRTRVIPEYDDYRTTFLQYKRVTLDHDAEVTVAHKSHSAQPIRKSSLRFRLSPAVASGALMVTPVVKGASAESVVAMRFRQLQRSQTEDFQDDGSQSEGVLEQYKDSETKQRAVLEQSESSQQSRTVRGEVRNVHASEMETEMKVLETTLQSYRSPWARRWRAPSKNIGCCGFSFFEVVADQIYPGEVELEVWVTGDNNTRISDVLVTTRVSWAEAEVELLDQIMKDHFSFFNDPEAIVHGLPMGALKKDDPKLLTLSNPTEWGYAMQSWVIMAETGVLTPEEAVDKLSVSMKTLETLQDDPDEFAHGMFYPYYRMRDTEDGKKMFPTRSDAKELPCGDDALFYASLLMVQGWLKSNRFNTEANSCARILGRMDFSNCVHKTHCDPLANEDSNENSYQGDRYLSIALTFNADTLERNFYSWNVWADEGGIVSMVVALSGGINFTQYEKIAREQQRYSPCTHWQGITVGQSAFFNSIFTLPTRSMLGFGTLFASPYYHEFAVRSVLPSFRAHQKLKKKLGVDYMGPSDAMSQQAKPGKFYGSYAYWPPNNMYDCTKGKSTIQNQCTWCKGIQYEGLDDPFEMIVPHGNMASFVASAMMERSQFTSWLEDTKLLMTDASNVYAPGYGLEVVAPARRTPLEGKFEGALDGRGIWESLSYGYTVLSMYEGLATMRRRYELVKQEGMKVPAKYEPPKYKPLSDFVTALPEVRSKIDKLLAIAREQESTEKQCGPSHYGPAGHY